MSASSTPTRRPRSRRPSARLSAVVDLPTPPLPDATAMIAPTPATGACLPIGDPCGACGARCELTGGTPWRACGRELGDGGPPGLRSAVSAIIDEVTPGTARTAASAFARTSSQAFASAASTLIEKNTLPSLTTMSDRTPASGNGAPRGDITLPSASRTCCAVTLTHTLLGQRSAPVPASLLFRRLVVELDHHAVRVADEDLPQVAAGTSRASNANALAPAAAAFIL